MKQLAVLIALAACGDDKPQRIELPGALMFVEDAPAPQLVRIVAGKRTVIGRDLYPSRFALPDGRIVAIASRGDGSAGSEQLALIGTNVERIGPAATQVRDPAVDSRGRWIVAAINLDGHSDLYRVDVDPAGQLHSRGKATRITNDVQGNYAPATIGDSIVYVSSRDGDSEIYRDAQRLTAFHRDDWQPTPSPDGRTIAFLSDRDSTQRVYLMDADGANLRRLTANVGEESEPTWSRDGKQLAYVIDGQVRVRDMTTGSERVITAPGVREVEPTFSPDGHWLAVSRVRGNATDCWAISLDAGESTPIAQNARLPRWF
jgi:Tol biopolymer transport system component